MLLTDKQLWIRGSNVLLFRRRLMGRGRSGLSFRGLASRAAWVPDKQLWIRAAPIRIRPGLAPIRIRSGVRPNPLLEVVL